MKLSLNFLSIAGLIIVIASTAALATGGNARCELGRSDCGVKDQSRFLSSHDETTDVGDYAPALIQLAQVGGHDGPPGPPPGLRQIIGSAPTPFGPPPHPPGPISGGPPLMGEVMMAGIAPDSVACEEDIARGAAYVTYLKTKLRLQGPQRDAWWKMEAAAEPIVDEMHKACATLPARPDGPPKLSATIAVAEKQLKLRAALVGVIAGSLENFYEMLSPEQRAMFDRPPPMF